MRIQTVLKKLKQAETAHKRAQAKRDRRTGRYKKDQEIIERETVHFTGASLFTVGGRLFLFDIDREEIKHRMFNAFLVQIPDSKVQTIADAYESLKPEAVKRAEKQGLEIERQGEWFFIPVPKAMCKALDAAHLKTKVKRAGWDHEMYPQFRLQAGENRPNVAEHGVTLKSKGDEVHYVRLKIHHSGREHRDLILKTWHIAIPNTAIESFTIRGEID